MAPSHSMASSNVNESSELKDAVDQIPRNTHSTVSEADTRRAVLNIADNVAKMQDEMRKGFTTFRTSYSADAFIINRAKHITKMAALHYKRKDEEIRRLQAQLDAKDEEIKEICQPKWQCDYQPASCRAKIGELRAGIKAREEARERNNLARWQNILNVTVQDQRLVAMQDAKNEILRDCPTDLKELKTLTDSEINQLLTDLGLSLHGSVEQRHYRLADYMGVANRIFCLGQYLEGGVTCFV